MATTSLPLSGIPTATNALRAPGLAYTVFSGGWTESAAATTTAASLASSLVGHTTATGSKVAYGSGTISRAANTTASGAIQPPSGTGVLSSTAQTSAAGAKTTTGAGASLSGFARTSAQGHRQNPLGVDSTVASTAATGTKAAFNSLEILRTAILTTPLSVPTLMRPAVLPLLPTPATVSVIARTRAEQTHARPRMTATGFKTGLAAHATLWPSLSLYPSAGLWPGMAAGAAPISLRLTERETFTAPVVFRPRTVQVRERMPLRLVVNIDTPSGHHARWAIDDESVENIPSSLSFSTVMPGGFENFGCVLQRDPDREWPDLEELATVTVEGVGGKTAWQGRLEALPMTDGDEEQVAPSGVGGQAYLTDDPTAREVFVDRNISAWQDPSVARQIAGIEFSPAVTFAGGGVGPDASSIDPTTVAQGYPSLVLSFDGTWDTNRQYVEAWYDAHGIALGELVGIWQANKNTLWPDGTPPAPGTFFPDLTKWALTWSLADNDNLAPVGKAGVWTDVWDGASQDGGYPDEMGAQVQTGSFRVSATTNTRKWAQLVLANENPSGGIDGATVGVYFLAIGVYGNHGLPLVGSVGFDAQNVPQCPGVLASDVVPYALQKWAPKLHYTTGVDGTVQPSSFVIPQLVFLDPTTVGEMIKEAVKYELLDWAVWESATVGWRKPVPAFYMNARGGRGRKWRVRSGPAKLQGSGPQIARIANQVLVQFTDVFGTTRYVGPPGSGANTEDASLLDSDPSNPANEAGIKKTALVTLGTSTAAAALRVGQLFLQQQKAIDRSGQAVLTGHVQDEHGIWWPAWMVRAGDQISFTDAHDARYRRIVHTQWDDGGKANTIQLDQPPDTMTAILERLSESIQPFGQS